MFYASEIRGICHEKFWKNYRKVIFVIWDYATSKFEGPQPEVRET